MEQVSPEDPRKSCEDAERQDRNTIIAIYFICFAFAFVGTESIVTSALISVPLSMGVTFIIALARSS